MILEREQPMKHRIQPFCISLLSAVLCVSVCSKTEEIPEEQGEETVMISRTLQICAKGSSGGK